MTIDELAHAAATDARRHAGRDIDPSNALRQLHRARHRRSVATALSVVVVGALAVVAGGAVVAHQRTGAVVVPPLASLTPSTDPQCSVTGITCLGPGLYRLALPVPVTVAVPPSFEGATIALGDDAAEDYRNDVTGHTGVTVFEKAVPVRYDNTWSRDATAGTTARSMTTWLSKRPFLTHTSITPTSVGGRPAWRVAADLKPGVDLPASKNNESAAPTFGGAVWNAAYTPSLRGSYTLLDVPGAGVVVIWSWTLDKDPQALVGNQEFIDGLTFG